MYHQCLVETACKGEYQHQRVVQSEAPHIIVPVQGTTAITEILVGTQQTAIASIDILDDELVATVINFIYDGVTISRVELPDTFTMLFSYRLQGVVNCQLEKQILQFRRVYPEWFE
jgi:hypothetical protein